MPRSTPRTAAQVPGGRSRSDATAPSEDEPDHLRAYRELLFGDRGQILNAMGQLEDECMSARDRPGHERGQSASPFRQVPASMSATGARASTRFFNKFDAGGGTVDHRGLLDTGGTKLMAEWLDVGAQYYNDPFAAPEN